LSLIVNGEDQGAEFLCWDFDRYAEGLVRHRFRAPRGQVIDGSFEPYWLGNNPRCPECGDMAFIDHDAPFTRAEFVAMLDALEANPYLWEEQMMRGDRPDTQFIAYARSLISADSGSPDHPASDAALSEPD